MTAITIPKTIEGATERLDGLGALLTASQWERAAIIYAFTDPITGNQVSRTDHLKESIERFTDRGITGLRSRNTVRAYRKAWRDAIDDEQAKDVAPGETTELPTRTWPETMTGAAHSAPANIAAAIKRDPGALAAAVDDDEEAFEAVARQVAAHPVLAGRVEVVAEQERERGRAERGERPPREKMPYKVAEHLLADLLDFWTDPVDGVGSREEVIRLIAANRNSPSLTGLAVDSPIPGQIADALRALAVAANKYADLLESTSAVEAIA